MVGHGLLAYFNRPRLAIVGVLPRDDLGWRVWYIVIANEGRSTARACAAQLSVFPDDPTFVDPGGGGQIQPVDGGAIYAANIGAIISWFRSDHPVEIAIHPYQRQQLEVCRSLLRSPRFNDRPEIRIPGDQGLATRATFSANAMEFAVQVGSDSAQPVAAFGRFSVSTLDSRLHLTKELRRILLLPRAPWWYGLPPARLYRFAVLTGRRLMRR